MTIIRVDHSDHNARIIMTECPCGKKFDKNTPYQRQNHFLEDHSPEDFGLSPLQEDVDERDQDELEDADDKRRAVA